MNPHDVPSNIGGICAAPGCQNTVFFSSSPFCSQHEACSSDSVVVNDRPSITNPPSRLSHLSDRTFVAKRGGRRTLKSSGRPSTKVKNQATPSGISQETPPKPCRSSQGTPVPVASTRGIYSPASTPDIEETGREHSIVTDLTTAQSQKSCTADNPSKPDHGAAPEAGSSCAASSKDLMKADRIHTFGQNTPLDDSSIHGLPTEAFESMICQAVDQPPPSSVFGRKQAPVTSMEPEIGLGRESKAEGPGDETVQVSAHIQVSLSAQRITGASSVSDIPKQLKPPSLTSPEKSVACDSSSGRMQASDAKGDKRDHRHSSTSLCRKEHENLLPQDGVKAAKPVSPQLPSTPTKIPTQQTNDESSKRIRSPPDVSTDANAEDDDESNMADISEDEDEESPSSTDSVLSPFRARIEARRKKRLAKFDSAAFDAFIYQQSDLRPPAGVFLRPLLPRNATASSEEPRLYLPVNPAIHRLHNRSEDWYKKKCQEIENRPGRKAWFGKVLERQRWLRAKEAKLEKARQMARMAGTTAPYKEPQPRGHKQILDFGDVPEEELPEDVRNNAAWLKACAWHRESMNVSLCRQRVVNSSAEETQRYFMEQFKSKPFGGNV